MQRRRGVSCPGVHLMRGGEFVGRPEPVRTEVPVALRRGLETACNHPNELALSTVREVPAEFLGEPVAGRVSVQLQVGQREPPLPAGQGDARDGRLDHPLVPGSIRVRTDDIGKGVDGRTVRRP